MPPLGRALIINNVATIVCLTAQARSLSDLEKTPLASSDVPAITPESPILYSRAPQASSSGTLPVQFLLSRTPRRSESEARIGNFYCPLVMEVG